MNSNNILSFLNISTKVVGKKKFQKIIYILQQKGADFKENFFFHYYGPFSYDLQSELENLEKRKLIYSEATSPANTYFLSDEGKNRLTEITPMKINDALVNRLNSISASKLELLASIYYLKDNGYNESKMIKKKIEILKPRLKKYLDDAFSIYEELESSYPNN